MTMLDSAATGSVSSDLTPETLYKFLISMKSSIQMARISIIHRHARLIVKLKAMIKKASEKDDQKSLSASALKNKRKATKLKNEVKTLKNLTENDIGKLVLLNTKDFKTVTKEGASAGVSAICRMAEHKAIVEQKLRFKNHFGESVTQLPFCVKVLGAERRSRKLRKLKADKKGRMLEYERRLCKLLAEIGGEEFAAAERLYVKVLNMKKSLEKRKKTEKAWAKAQGPLGDRKAGYEEYLKTVQEGEETQTFASYVKKMDAEQGNDESGSESSDDNNTSMKDADSSEDEGADPKQVELRKKIFEKLDAKFGEWDNEDDTDISDVDDGEVIPKKVKSRSIIGTRAHAGGEFEKDEKISVASKSSLSEKSLPSNKITTAKKRKRDENNSDVEGCNDTSKDRSELTESVEERTDASDDKSRLGDPETSATLRGPQPRVDDKIRPSLFSLFKKTGLTTKAPSAPAIERSKRKEPLDKNIKKSLYCEEEMSTESNSFLTSSASTSGVSFFQGGKGKDAVTLSKLFVGNKKKLVSENEAELSEIPESVAYEKAQKINRSGLAAECASDDEQEDLAGFNSTFLLQHEGQSLLQHMSLRGGKRRHVRGTDSRGGRGYKRGGFGRTSGGDDDATSFAGVDRRDEGFLGKKFGGASFSSGKEARERRGRGNNRGAVFKAANSRFEGDDGSLHPSWAAKRLNSGAITEFQGKRITFD
ncbi:hypothetical protein FHG87_003042 [Trinorchestia longiramus]|nr:hypothetical protein FHG87_003042 [Trinorchestia longiramus]